MSDVPITDDIAVIGDARYLRSDGEESGNDGHIIVNSAGSEMTQRSKLKFQNATVTDDAENDATIVTPTVPIDPTPTSGSSNAVSSGGVFNALGQKQNTLTFDNTPTAGSDNPVKSRGIKTALDAKQNTLTFDNAPTAGSDNPVKSRGIKTALDAKQNTLTFDDAPRRNSNKPVKSDGVWRNDVNERVARISGGCANILEPTLTTQVIDGVTITVDESETSAFRGMITLSGTATDNVGVKVGNVGKFNYNDNIRVMLRGCPSGGTASTYWLDARDSETWYPYAYDTGNGVSINNAGTSVSGADLEVWLCIRSGVNVDGFVLYPMIYAYHYNSTDPYSEGIGRYDYIRHTKSNWQLTKEQDRLQMAGYNVQGSDILAYNQGAFNVQSFSQTGMVPGQPSTYGFMQTMTRGHNTEGDSKEIHQLWFTQDNGDLYHRGTNYNTYSNPPAFKKILDDSNWRDITWHDYAYMDTPTLASFVQRTAQRSGCLVAFFVKDMNNVVGLGGWCRGIIQYQNAYTNGNDVQGYGILSHQDGKLYSITVSGTSSSGFTRKCIPVENYVPRDGNLYNANLAPQKNTFRYREVTGTRANQNLPGDGWFHLVDSMGEDSNYFCQLAIGMTVSGLWYRRKYGSTYSKWYKCDASWTWMQGGTSTNLYTLGRQDFTELHIHIYKDNNYFTLDVMTEDLHDSTLRFFRVGSGGGNHGGCIMKISRKQIQMHEFYIANTNYTTSASYNVYFK